MKGLFPSPGDLGPVAARPPLRNERKGDVGSAPRGSISGVQFTRGALGVRCGMGPGCGHAQCVMGEGHRCLCTVGLRVAQAARDTRGLGGPPPFHATG